MSKSLQAVFPHPEAATLIVKKFITLGLVLHLARVVGPQREEINGSNVPICNDIGALHSWYSR